MVVRWLVQRTTLAYNSYCFLCYRWLLYYNAKSLFIIGQLTATPPSTECHPSTYTRQICTDLSSCIFALLTHHGGVQHTPVRHMTKQLPKLLLGAGCFG